MAATKSDVKMLGLLEPLAGRCACVVTPRIKILSEYAEVLATIGVGITK